MLDDTFLTTGDVLGYLRVNLRTVYRLIKAGKIPAVRVGRQWRCRKSDLDAWLESQRAGRAAAATPRRVLVAIEDDGPNGPLTGALMAAGYDIDAVTDGRSALDRLRRVGADLLITGLRLPGMDGLARHPRGAARGPATAGHHRHRLLQRGLRHRSRQPGRSRLSDGPLHDRTGHLGDRQGLGRVVAPDNGSAQGVRRPGALRAGELAPAAR